MNKLEILWEKGSWIETNNFKTVEFRTRLCGDMLAEIVEWINKQEKPLIDDWGREIGEHWVDEGGKNHYEPKESKCECEHDWCADEGVTYCKRCKKYACELQSPKPFEIEPLNLAQYPLSRVKREIEIEIMVENKINEIIKYLKTK